MVILRKSDATLEQCRQVHYLASDAINIAQASYYEANAVVTNLENRVKQNDESRGWLTQQVQQISISNDRNTANIFATKKSLFVENAELDAANGREHQALFDLQALTYILPEKKALLRQTKLAHIKVSKR